MIKKILNKKLFSTSRGATLVEFAIVVPLLLLVLFGIISIAMVYQAKSALEKGAEQGLAVASVIPDLEDTEAPSFNTITTQVREEALAHPLSVFFENGVDDLGGSATPGTSRIVEANLDLFPDPELPPDLTDHFSDNPISMELVAEVDTLFWFLPSITLRALAVGYREPRFLSSLPRPFVCDPDGPPGAIKEIDFNSEIPEQCPCPDTSDPRVIFNADSGTCLCASPLVDIGTPEGPLHENPERCICSDADREISYDPVACVCRSCEDLGWVGADGPVDTGDDCVCSCPEPFQGEVQSDGTTHCICPEVAFETCPSQYIVEGEQCVCNSDCVAAACEAMEPPKVLNSSCGCSNCLSALSCDAEPSINKCQIIEGSQGHGQCRCNSSLVRSCCHAKNAPYKGATDSQGCGHGNCGCGPTCPGNQVINPSTEECECPPGSPSEAECNSQGQPYNPELCECDPACTDGQVLIEGSCQCPECEPGLVQGPGCICEECPAGLFPHGDECLCFEDEAHLAQLEADCIAGGSMGINRDTCECEECPGEQVPDPVTPGKCVCDNDCGPYIDPQGENCECGCPPGYTYLPDACGGEPCCQPPDCQDCYWDGEWIPIE